ncbi:MAG TPA: hypothetical protein VHZ78_06080 [Rhizomicrobium sp.]|jgi:hypothetical protein|nr:hypothetical protein [Rhizomicrobium sp.]
MADLIEQPHPGAAYQMVSQACAMAMQDAVAYLRSMQTVSIATIGAAQSALLNDPANADQTKAIMAAQESIARAIKTLEDINGAAVKILGTFPRI